MKWYLPSMEQFQKKWIILYMKLYAFSNQHQRLLKMYWMFKLVRSKVDSILDYAIFTKLPFLANGEQRVECFSQEWFECLYFISLPGNPTCVRCIPDSPAWLCHGMFHHWPYQNSGSSRGHPNVLTISLWLESSNWICSNSAPIKVSFHPARLSLLLSNGKIMHWPVVDNGQNG